MEYSENNNFILYQNNMTLDLHKELSDKDWFYISYSFKLKEEFIIKYEKNLHWGILIPTLPIVSINFLEKYKNKLNWANILKHNKLSCTFLIKIHDHFNKKCWDTVSQFQEINENFRRVWV